MFVECHDYCCLPSKLLLMKNILERDEEGVVLNAASVECNQLAVAVVAAAVVVVVDKMLKHLVDVVECC